MRFQFYSQYKLPNQKPITSDVVVKYIVLRLFFAENINDIQRLQEQYASKCKVPNERKRGKGL